MIAIVEIKGQQFKVTEGQEIFVHSIDATAGDKLSFDRVFLTENGGNVSIGTPVLSTKVNATVLEHAKGDKVIVFKKKRRKSYQKSTGHRQHFTKIKIDSIA